MEQHETLEASLLIHLSKLTENIGARPTGSTGNQQAGEYIQSVFARYGWQVETQDFDCLTWEPGTILLMCEGHTFTAQINPYSPSFQGHYPLFIVRSVAALQVCGSLENHIVMLADALSQEPYMPKRFPFVSFEEQQQIIRLLEKARPAAIIGINVNPLFCDADFQIPSVTVTPETGKALAAYQGKRITLAFTSHTLDSTGSNVLANSTEKGKKIVICAHYDTWFDTPGAIDNATGVTALLGLAELLDPKTCPVQLVAFNGEDHYLAPGQVAYLSRSMPEIGFVVNLDGIGAKERNNSVSYYGDDHGLFDKIKAKKAAFPNLVEVDPWPMGDHMIFVQRGIPAIALSCEKGYELYLNGIAHTPADMLTGVDASKVYEAIEFVRDVIG